MRYTCVSMHDSLRSYRISEGMALAKANRFKIDQQNRLYKELHIRTKPKLVASAATGGFKLTKKGN